MKDMGLPNRIILLPCDRNRPLDLRECMIFCIFGKTISKNGSDAERNAYNAGNSKGDFTKMIKGRDLYSEKINSISNDNINCLYFLLRPYGITD